MTRYNRKVDTKHIRDASSDQARQLAYHYYDRAIKAERRLAGLSMPPSEAMRLANVEMAIALDAVRAIVCPEG